MFDSDIALARSNFVVFLETCIGDQKSGQAIRLAPLHRLLIDELDLAMESGRFLFAAAPVRHGKTSIGEGAIVFLLGRDSSTRGKVVAATEQRAIERVDSIRKILQRNGRVRGIFPDLRIVGRGRSNRIFLEGHDTQRDPAVEAVSVTSGVEGSAVDFLFVDDADDRRSQISTARREEVRGAVTDVYLNRLEPGAAVFAICTRWSPDDLYGFFADDEETRTRWSHSEMRIPDDLAGIEASEVGAGPKVVLPLGWKADSVRVPTLIADDPDGDAGHDRDHEPDLADDDEGGE